MSTDPASNVAQVLGVTIGNASPPIPDVPVWRRWRSTPSRRPTPTGSASSARSVACSRGGARLDRGAALWLVHHRGRCPSTSSLHLLTDDRPSPTATTTSSSTPLPPATRSGCCSFPARGPTSSTTARATPPALGRSPASTAPSRSTRRRRRRSPTPPAPGSSSSRGPSLRADEIDRTSDELGAIGIQAACRDQRVLPARRAKRTRSPWLAPREARWQPCRTIGALPRDVLDCKQATWWAAALRRALRTGRARRVSGTEADPVPGHWARWWTRSSATATGSSCAWARVASARPPSPPPSRSPWLAGVTRCS